MYSTRKVISLIAMIILIAACSKSDDKPKTKTELLTNGSWKLTTANFHGDSDGNGSIEDIDLLTVFPDCSKDDFTTYYANGNAQGNEGPTKCDADSPQTDDYNWVFKENETILNDGGLDYTILELTATTLKLILYDPFGSGFAEYKATFTFSH
jgi:hypothetical protein